MVNKVKSATKRRFRRTNFDAFIFFLFFAIIVWIFVQFSKQYSVIVDIPVDYVNVPLNKFLTEDNPETLKMRMENSGFKIAWYSLFPPTFNLDISKTEEAGGQLIYRTVDNRVEIQNQLDIDFENSQFLKKVITVDYEPRQEKILPVFSEIEIEFAVGYAADNLISISPDSVKISGPEAVLDTLNELHTVPLNLKNISKDLSGTVALDTSNLEQVSFYKNKVSYKLDVKKFTEGKVKVPVELIHVPDGMNVVIFPKEVLLFYQVNLQNFNKVTASDFRVVSDFRDLKENQNFLIPKIVQQPIFVSNLRLNENKIQFIIKK